MALVTTSPLNFPMEFKFDDSDSINIPNHGTIYTVTWKALKLSEMIRSSFLDIFFSDIQINNLGDNLYPEAIINIEQTGEGLKKNITLIGETFNTIEGPVFKIVIEMIKYYADHEKFKETSFKEIHDVSLVMLFDVYKASNFFNIPELLEGCAKYIASLIKNKTKEEIEAIFLPPITDGSE